MGNVNPNEGGGGGGGLQRPGAPGGRSGDRVIPFGKYLLLDRIAVGGMAEVYTAKSFGVEGFEKIIAIKRILPTMAEDEDFIAMFIDEAKIAGHLTHANVVPIYELGKIGESHYIAMEYVWGKDLLQIMNRFRRMRRHMPPVMAAWLASKMCEGLDFAHRKRDRHGKPLNIVHRDVSPQNCIVSYEGQVKMIDFGIAKAAARNTKTQAGVLKGKFGYMSPEQVSGAGIDHRSDVFAVGTCMHEMLTGERLFVGESDFSTLEKVRNADVVPPSMVVQDMPKELEAIVLKALSRDPQTRWQSAGEMHEALQQYIAKEKPPFGTSKLASWMRTAFAAEMTKEKARLDGFAKIGKPASVPPPPPRPAPEARRPPPPPRPSAPVMDAAAGGEEDDDGLDELQSESTMISASPFDEMMDGGGGAEPEELQGEATQIFFSAEDEAVDEEQTAAYPSGSLPPDQRPTTVPLEGQFGGQFGQPSSVLVSHAVQVQSRPAGALPGEMAPQGGFGPPPGAPQHHPGGMPAGGMPMPGAHPQMAYPMPQQQGGFAVPPQQQQAPQYGAPPPAFSAPAQHDDPGLRPRAAGQETMEMRPPTVKKSRAGLFIGLGVAGFVSIAAALALFIVVAGGSSGGTIEIRTSPPEAGATVLVDGTPRGRAPLRLDHVPTGDHLVEIQAPGYQSSTQTVPVVDGATAMLMFPLIPGAAGVAVASAGAGVPPVGAPPAIAPLPAPAATAPPTPAATVVAPAAAAVPPAAVVPAPAAVAPPAAAPAAPTPAPQTPVAVAVAPVARTAPAAQTPPARTAEPAPTRTAEAAPTRTAEAAPTRTARTGSASAGTASASRSETRAETTAARPTISTSVAGTGPRRLPRAEEDEPASTTPRRGTTTTRPEPRQAAAPAGRGTLMIQTLPWARVFIDGRDTGQNTPVRSMSVSAGSHRIGLRTNDGRMHEVTVDVPAGETVRIVRQL